MEKFDEIDQLILQTLLKEGRITWSELAQRLKLSAPSTADRVRRLEEAGVIRGYQANLSREQLGFSLTAFISVDLASPKYREEFHKIVRDRGEIIECHHVTGDHDYLLKVICRDTEHLNTLLNQVLKGGEVVAKTYTTMVLGESKEFVIDPAVIAES